MTSKLTITSIEDAMTQIGQELGLSQWRLVDQQSINVFGAVTGDEQWIHTDADKASKGPFGGAIAHGLYTLSLAGGGFFHETVKVNARMGVNYGCNRVRYPSSLLVGKRVRGRSILKGAEAIPGNGVQLVVEVAVEIEEAPKPACVAEFIVRYFF